MTTGTVVDGKIVVSDDTLPDGVRVTVLIPESAEEEGFTVGAEEEAALLESIREADTGRVFDGDDVLRETMSPALG